MKNKAFTTITKYIKTISPWVFTFMVLWFLFTRVSISEVGGSLSSANHGLLIVTLIISAFACLYAGAEKYKHILSVFGINISSKQARIIRMGTLPVKLLMPLMVGEVVRASYLNKEFTLKYKNGVLNMALNYGMRVVALALIALAGGTVFGAIVPELTFIGLLIVTVTIVYIEVTYKYPVSKIMGYSLLLETCLILNILIIFKAMDMVVPLKMAIMYIPVTLIAASFHISIAGAGLRESAMILLFAGLASQEKLLAAGIVASIVNGIWPAIIGLIYIRPFFTKFFASTSAGKQDAAAYLEKRRKSLLLKHRMNRRTGKIIESIKQWQKKIAPGGEAGLKVLDVGAADGRILSILNDNFKIDKAVGIEPSQYLIDAKTDSSIEIIKGEGENMPFDNNVFDVVIAASVIEHVKDSKKLMRECHRVLNKGGVLVVSAVDPFLDKVASFLGFKPNDHVETFSMEELKTLFSDSDFDVIGAEKFGMLSLGLLPFEDKIEKFFNKIKMYFAMYYQLVSGVKNGQ